MEAPVGHVGGQVSASNYSNRGCRCAGCRAANTAAQRERRKSGTPPSVRAHQIATNQAAKWVRVRHPGQWRRLLDAAYMEVGRRGR